MIAIYKQRIWLPHARESYRRGYDPDGFNDDGPLSGVMNGFTVIFLDSHGRLWECMMKSTIRKNYDDHSQRRFVRGSTASFYLPGHRRRFDEFSREGSAARQPLVNRCDVPEEFIEALVCDVVHPAIDALDKFLYGFDAEVASSEELSVALGTPICRRTVYTAPTLGLLLLHSIKGQLNMLFICAL
ncbi:hypothetical protein EVAR_95591_1 [Eumeta japonica]|uniref:Uncharacterized protein n=1 Tax=Eumeta variegata TaxID=151549 RepID=A0A4C1VKP0_EUMVA|nr:hypothetical protein EVAR_95591_1 [Eumeta japonica]